MPYQSIPRRTCNLPILSFVTNNKHGKTVTRPVIAISIHLGDNKATPNVTVASDISVAFYRRCQRRRGEEKQLKNNA